MHSNNIGLSWVQDVSKIKIYMAPIKTGDRSDLIYSWRAIHGLHRCYGRDRCGQTEQERRLSWV